MYSSYDPHYSTSRSDRYTYGQQPDYSRPSSARHVKEPLLREQALQNGPSQLLDQEWTPSHQQNGVNYPGLLPATNPFRKPGNYNDGTSHRSYSPNPYRADESYSSTERFSPSRQHSPSPQPLYNSHVPPSYEDATQAALHWQQSHESSTETTCSHSLNTAADLDPTDQEILTSALEFTRHAPSSLSNIPLLRLPIAIPQVTFGLGQAFARVWAPELAAHDISQAEFLTFIDNLNIVSAPNAPLQAVNMVGSVIGLVPHHWAQLAGGVLSATAGLGTAAVSRGRREMYMREANRQFFTPRKLSVRIMSSDDMARLIGMPLDAPLVTPLTSETLNITSQERRLAAIRPYISPLVLDVPPPAEQTTILAKLSAKQIALSERKNEKKVMKQRIKILNHEEEGQEDEVGGGTRRSARKERKKERKNQRRDKEAKHATKISWIVITNM